MSTAAVAASGTAARYPKRRRTVVNYQVDHAIDLDEDEAELSEELGENVTTSSKDVTGPVDDESDHDEIESELEDATYGSRKSNKRALKKRLQKTQAKKKPKRAPKFKPFRLMNLPGELRMKVYEEALVDPHGIYIRTYDDKYEKMAVHVAPRFIDGVSYLDRKGYVKGEWKDINMTDLPTKRFKISPNLLATCKKVHDEAVSLLWKQPFIFADVHGLYSFLLPMDQVTISRLENITILKHGWVMGRTIPAFMRLRHATNLQNLRFDCVIRNAREYRHSSMGAKKLGEKLADRIFKDCSPFIKDFVKQQGAEALAKVLKFDREEFKQRYWSAHNNHGTDDWSEEKEKQVLEAMTDHITTIINRKSSPKFPRG